MLQMKPEAVRRWGKQLHWLTLLLSCTLEYPDVICSDLIWLRTEIKGVEFDDRARIYENLENP